MHMIISYDASSSVRRKLHKICKKYLFQVHESVFEGEISDKKRNRLKEFIAQNIDYETDSVVIYRASGPDSFIRESIGVVPKTGNLFL